VLIALVLPSVVGTATGQPSVVGTATAEEAFPRGRLAETVTPERYSLTLEIDPSQPEFSGEAESALRINQASRPLDRHRRTRARAPDADPRVPTNPPGPALPPRRGPLSPRNITAQPVRRNSADTFSVDNSR